MMKLSLFNEHDTFLEVYKGFPTIEDCTRRLFMYDKVSLLGEYSSSVCILYDFFTLVHFMGNYYIAHYDISRDKALIIGQNRIFYMMDGIFYDDKMGLIKPSSHSEDAVDPNLPFYPLGFSKTPYDNPKLFDLMLSVDRDLDVLALNKQKGCWESILHEPYAKTYAMYTFWTMLNVFLPVITTPFIRYFSYQDTKRIEQIMLEDARICAVNPFRSQIKLYDGSIRYKSIFKGHYDYLNPPVVSDGNEQRKPATVINFPQNKRKE